MEQRFCYQCGSRLTPGAKFCNVCGTPIIRAEPAPAPVPAPEPAPAPVTKPTAPPAIDLFADPTIVMKPSRAAPPQIYSLDDLSGSGPIPAPAPAPEPVIFTLDALLNSQQEPDPAPAPRPAPAPQPVPIPVPVQEPAPQPIYAPPPQPAPIPEPVYAEPAPLKGILVRRGGGRTVLAVLVSILIFLLSLGTLMLFTLAPRIPGLPNVTPVIYWVIFGGLCLISLLLILLLGKINRSILRTCGDTGIILMVSGGLLGAAGLLYHYVPSLFIIHTDYVTLVQQTLISIAYPMLRHCLIPSAVVFGAGVVLVLIRIFGKMIVVSRAAKQA